MSLLLLFNGSLEPNTQEGYNFGEAYDTNDTYGGLSHLAADRPVWHISIIGTESGEFWGGVIAPMTVGTLDEVAYIVQDYTDKTMEVEIERGRSASSYDGWDPGRCTIRFVDDESALLTGMIGQPVRVFAFRSRDGVTIPPAQRTFFAGSVDSTATDFPQGTDAIAYTTITAYDGTRVLNRADVTMAGTPHQRPAERITALLTHIAYEGYASLDNLTDSVLCEDSADQQTALNALRRIESSEGGAMFFSGDGTFIFRGRDLAWPQGNPVALISDDDSDPHNISYTSIRRVESDDVVANRVTVTGQGFEDQVVNDTASQTSRGRRNLSVDTLLGSESEAVTLGTFLLNNRADELIVARFEQVEIAAYASEANLEFCWQTDLLQVVRVERRAPGSTLTEDLNVVGVRHRITPDDWRVVLTLQTRV